MRQMRWITQRPVLPLTFTLVTVAAGLLCSAPAGAAETIDQPQTVSRSPARVSSNGQQGQILAADVGQSVDVPQAFVECTGWHALCSASTDCRMIGDKASCDCLRVNESHIVETNEIQDYAVKVLTQANCTTEHPCDVDQAPVCTAIKHGQYTVEDVKYDWVSTFSYRGWCSLVKGEPKACDQHAKGYTGDLYWAICDAAPCTEDRNPLNPDKPLSCQCRVKDTPFLGTNGSCTGDNAGIMSSSPLEAWDFQNNTYRIPVPGLEYVQGACAPLKSDPLKEPRRDRESR